MAASTLSKRYTYADYKNLDVDDNFLYELLNGELGRKSAPKPSHQRIVRKILVAFNAFVEAGKLGEVFSSPIDVFLDEYNVPQPDLVFVSNARKALVTEDGIMGAPDLVIEVISPSSVVRDRVEKMKLYRQYRIPEYWIVDPSYATVEVYTLAENEYDLLAYAIETGTVHSKVLTGFSLAIAPVFTAE